MKNKKIVKIIVILFIIMIFSLCIEIGETSIFPTSISQYAAVNQITSGNYTYRENSDGTICITRYSGDEVNVIVPSSIDGKKVTKFQNDSFYNLSKLKTVTISEGIEYVEMYTFSGCANLENVIFPNSIKYISRYFYKTCPKIKYNIPSHLKKMEEGTYISVATVTVNGTKNYDYAYEVFELTNQERANEGLAPLEYSAELTEIAMKRAAEISIYWDHIRPCGMDCMTISSMFEGENIGALQKTPSRVVTGWMNSALHRRAILDSSYNSIGIGCNKINGIYYWVQLFSADESRNKNAVKGTQDLEYNVDIKSNDETLESLLVYEYSNDITLKIGETKTVTKVILKNLGIKEKLNTNVETQISTTDVTWESSDVNVFTVDNKGTITAVGPGNAILTAKLGDYNKNFNISVVADGVYMSLDKKKYQLNGVNSTVQLKAMLNTGTQSKADWKSSNDTVATVDSNGIVTAKNGGFVTITAENAFGKDECFIYVCALRTLSDGSKAYPGDLNRDGTINSTDMAIILDWGNKILANDEIAIGDINSDGVVNSTDAAMLQDFYNSEIQFKPGEYLPITDITLNKTNITGLEVGLTEQLIATITPNNTTDSPIIIWSSSNTNVATVNESGMVKAVGGGNATITAIANNGKGKTANCIINVAGDPLEVPITGIALNQNSLDFSNKNQTFTLVATITPNNTTQDKTVIWTSSNPNVATVDENGKVTSKSAGTSNITARTSNGLTAVCKVNIIEPAFPITSITLNKTSIKIGQGKTETLIATILPENHTYSSKLTWSSSDTNVATVDDNGKVTAKKDGTATITVTTVNGKSATCAISVKGSMILTSSVELNKLSLTLNENETETLIALILPENHTDSSKLTWSSSNTNVATVDSNGKVTAIKAGTAIITVTVNGKEAKCTLKVDKINQDYLKGDVNKDHFINATDAAIILDFFKNGGATEEDFQLGDMNNDNLLNATDAAMILDIFKNSQLQNTKQVEIPAFLGSKVNLFFLFKNIKVSVKY